MSIGGITTTGAQYSKTWEKSALLRICDISQNTKKIPSTQTFQKTMRLASWLFFPLWMISQFIFFLLFFVVVWFHEFYYYHYCSITPSPFLGHCSVRRPHREGTMHRGWIIIAQNRVGWIVTTGGSISRTLSLF